MRRPPHWMVAHMGRGVTPHCSWHLSMDSFMLKGCSARTIHPNLPLGWHGIVQCHATCHAFIVCPKATRLVQGT